MRPPNWIHIRILFLSFLSLSRSPPVGQLRRILLSVAQSLSLSHLRGWAGKKLPLSLDCPSTLPRANKLANSSISEQTPSSALEWEPKRGTRINLESYVSSCVLLIGISRIFRSWFRCDTRSARTGKRTASFPSLVGPG